MGLRVRVSVGVSVGVRVEVSVSVEVRVGEIHKKVDRRAVPEAVEGREAGARPEDGAGVKADNHRDSHRVGADNHRDSHRDRHKDRHSSHRVRGGEVKGRVVAIGVVTRKDIVTDTVRDRVEVVCRAVVLVGAVNSGRLRGGL